MKVRLQNFQRENRSQGLSSSYITLLANILSKAATRKTRICIFLLTIAHPGKDQQAASGRINGVGCRCSAAHDIRAANTLGGISGIYDEL